MFVQESFHFFKYKKSENILYEYADDIAPRHLISALPLDYDTIAGGDKFGNFFIVRLPADVSAQVNYNFLLFNSNMYCFGFLAYSCVVPIVILDTESSDIKEDFCVLGTINAVQIWLYQDSQEWRSACPFWAIFNEQ